MGSATTNVKLKFSHVHPHHHLIHNSQDQSNYICAACNTSGFGDRFRCLVCVADIHVYCADCPPHFSSSLHHHPLALNLNLIHRRICDICRESIAGISYVCNLCDFHVHPLCTQLPNDLRHVIDDTHKLSLKKVPFGSCGVCNTDCSSLWVYGCDFCRLNVHLSCLRKPYAPPASGSRTRGMPHGPPPFAGYGYGGHYNNYGFPWPWHSPSPWGFYPNYNFVYPPPGPDNSSTTHNDITSPSPDINGGGHEPPPSPSRWGSLLGNTMFSLIGSIASGAINGYLFGSAGF